MKRVNLKNATKDKKEDILEIKQGSYQLVI